MIVVVMGVAGAGKTTVGAGLAERMGAAYLEGDKFHPDANVAKMASGQPLDDADRQPWLRRIAAVLDDHRQASRDVVLACSALRRSYRSILRDGRNDVVFVHLAGSKELIRQRLDERRGHFMPPTLLDSQFSTLEAPGPDEPVVEVDIAHDPASIVERILADVRSLDVSPSAPR